MKKRHLLTVVTCLLTSCTNTVYRTDSTPDVDQKSRIYFLPKGEVQLTIERKEDDAPIEVGIVPNFVADTDIPLYLHHNHSVWYDDKYVVETDKYGLLQTINTTTNFKGEDIVKKLGNLIGTAENLMFSASEPNLLDDTKVFCNTKKFKTEIHIDPYKDSSEQINKILPSDRCIRIGYDLLKVGEKPNLNKPIESILYRHLTNFSVKIEFNDKQKKIFYEKTLRVGLPDLNKIEHFNVDRGYFVDRDTKLAFINGVLTKEESTYPSEVLGFISLPLELVNGISNAITGRFDLKTKELQNETTYLQAQKSRNDALNSGTGK